MTSDTRHCYLTGEDCRLADLIDLVNQKTDLADYPYASTVEQNVPSYDGARLRAELSRPAGRAAVEAELAGALLDGPGIVVLEQPVDGLAPPTQAEILARAVAERWSRQQLETELSAWNTRRTA
jgi:hypothetical protein